MIAKNTLVRHPCPPTIQQAGMGKAVFTVNGLRRPTAICTLRRWPSETWCIRQLGFTSIVFMTRALRSSLTLGTELSIFEAGKSPCRGTS